MLDPDAIEAYYREVLKETHEPSQAGIAVTAMIEADPDHFGPYDDETRDWMQRWFTDECSYNRILIAFDRAESMSPSFALSTDDGENLIDDDEQIIETYPG